MELKYNSLKLTMNIWLSKKIEEHSQFFTHTLLENLKESLYHTTSLSDIWDIKYSQVYFVVAGFSVLCEALANGDEAMAKGKSLDYVDCTWVKFHNQFVHMDYILM
jgi:hypothetical protein